MEYTLTTSGHEMDTSPPRRDDHVLCVWLVIDLPHCTGAQKLGQCFHVTHSNCFVDQRSSSLLTGFRHLLSVPTTYVVRRRRYCDHTTSWCMCVCQGGCLRVYHVSTIKRNPWSEWLETWQCSNSQHFVEACWFWVQKVRCTGSSFQTFGTSCHLANKTDFTKFLSRVSMPMQCIQSATLCYKFCLSVCQSVCLSNAVLGQNEWIYRHILHGDQTRCEANFYTVDHECWGDLFAVSNLLVRKLRW